MVVTSNTLSTVRERWDDPGGRGPCGGMAARPSSSFVAEITGTVQVSFDAVEHIDIAEYLSDLPHQHPEIKWVGAVADYMDGANLFARLRHEAPDGVERITRWEVLRYDPATRVAELVAEEWEEE